MSTHGATGLGSRNSETKMGAIRSHRDTWKSTGTCMSAHTYTHKHTNAFPVHVSPLHTASPTTRGQQSRTAARAERSLPAAPLHGLAQQAVARRALAESCRS